MTDRLIFIHNHLIYGDDIEAIFNSLLSDFKEIKNKTSIHHDIELSEYYKLPENSQIVLKYNSGTGLCRLYVRHDNTDSPFQIIRLIISSRMRGSLEADSYATTASNNVPTGTFQNYDKIIEAEKTEIIKRTTKQTDIIKSLVNAHMPVKENIFIKTKMKYDFPDTVPSVLMIDMGKTVANLLSDIKGIICVIVPSSANEDYAIDLAIMITSEDNSKKFTQIINNLYTLQNDINKGSTEIISRQDKTISSTSVIKWVEKNITGIKQDENMKGGADSDSLELSLSDSFDLF